MNVSGRRLYQERDWSHARPCCESRVRHEVPPYPLPSPLTDVPQTGLIAILSKELATKLAVQEAERERLSRETEEVRRRDHEAMEKVRRTSVPTTRADELVSFP